ncbi:hydrolase or acyltransferase alpha beta hydrolase superfamily [Fusarium longipes]|uniref:Hydrolase or acyltransferase alpha beta hydrolase superfamily n=1 Tax=Fusarium longipes TaxID=694270 RepID=A0A395T7Y0_9HYPO|nr:hydrolase or acyltransferase alpha beta hydrolase superfamily [Fusarium longipes]
MRIQNIILGQVLLHSVQALSLPKEVHSLETRTNSKKPSLEWSKCDLDFGNEKLNELQKSFDCARLEVPLDYTNSSNDETIKLDLIRAKATKAPFKGSVLFNPGGPGGSGVEGVLGGASTYLPILGGHHDLIGFDIRGTGRTIPFKCPVLTQLRRREFNTLPQLDTWNLIRNDAWDISERQAEACYKENRDIGRFLGTTSIARDMMSIVDALDQGDKLNYWGVSYGTILGQVVASMFPERMGRILLDANLKLDDYAAATWLSSVRDAEKSISNLLDDCVKSGKELCSLADYHGKNTTGESLMDTFREKLEVMTSAANANTNATGLGPLAEGLVLFKSYILYDLYSASDYPKVASRIEGLFKGNETAILAPGGIEIASKWNPTGLTANLGVSCSDSSFRVEHPDDLFSMYQAHISEASWSDSSLAGRTKCARWKFSAVEEIDLNKMRNVKTSFPILVVNGKYDPVTPLSGAWEISAQFRKSRVVVHEGVGHSFTSHPSNCTQSAVAKYFVDGKLPKLNTTCKPDTTAFEYAELLASRSKDSTDEE